VLAVKRKFDQILATKPVPAISDSERAKKTENSKPKPGKKSKRKAASAS
jgi:hypothetical protein